VEGAPVHPPATLLALLGAVVLSFQAVLFTYDGWYGAIYFSEEVKDPAKTLPRSMLTGVLAVIALYLLINLALLYVVPLSQLATSNLAAADAARNVFGAGSDRVITVLSFLSLLSVTNAALLQSSRILFGLSRDGLFAERFATVNRGGTPTLGLLASTLVSIVLVASGTFEELIAVTSFFYVLMYGSGFVALFVLRAKEPGLPRPFRVPGYPWTTGVVLLLSAIFLVGVLLGDTRNSLYGLALLLLSYPVYRLTLRTGRGLAGERAVAREREHPLDRN
jgi:APA family basic amino acid/polyamine antiporter